MGDSSNFAPCPDMLPSFICPITHDVYHDPVITCDGQTYERTAIEKWFNDGNSTSPVTNQKLRNTNIIPNIVLKNVMAEYQGQTKIGQLRPDSSVYDLLSKYTLLKDQDKERYVSLFEEQGSYCIKLLVDGEYSKEDLASFAIKRPHITSILEAIQAAARGFPDERQGGKSLGAGGSNQGQQQEAQRPPPPVEAGQHEISSQERYRDLLNILRERRNPEAIKRALEAMAGGGTSGGNGFMTEQDTINFGSEVSEVLIHRVLEEEWLGDSNFVVGCTLRAINHLVCKRTSFMKELVDRGICQKVIKILITYQEDVVIQAQGWELVCSLSSTESYRKKLANAGECKAVTDSLTSMRWNPEVQKSMWYAVVNLVEGNNRYNEQYNVELGNCGACKLVGETLLHFLPDAGVDPSITVQALRAINSLAHAEENRVRFAGLGVCALVVQAFEKFIDSPGSLEVICCAVGELSIRNQENRRQLGEAKACKKVAFVLDLYEKIPRLQENCLWAIADLCSEDDKENQESLRAAGVCENILRALRTFPHADVQAAGCNAIANLTSGGNKANAEAFGPEGSKLIVKAVKSYHTNKNVLEHAFGAMMGLSDGLELNLEALIKEGAETEVLHAIRTFTSSDTVDIKKRGTQLAKLLGQASQNEGMASAGRLDMSSNKRRRLLDACIG